MNRIIYFLLLILFQNYISGQPMDGLSAMAINLHTGVEEKLGNVDLEKIPASIWKVPSCAMAYDVLGGDYQFMTNIYSEGEIDSFGVLHGDIVIVGEGDPSWKSQYEDKKQNNILQYIVGSIMSSGITCIQGDIVVGLKEIDEDPISPYWLWEDLGNYYATGCWGINYMDNVVKLTFVKGKTAPVLKAVNPILSNVSWTSNVTYGVKGSGDRAYIFGSPLQEQRIVRGTLPIDMNNMVVKGSLPDPPAFFAQSLRDALLEKGIQSQSVRKKYKKNWKGTSRLHVITTRLSPNLESLITLSLENSDNLFVEAIARKALPANNYRAFLEKYKNQLNLFGLIEHNPKDACGLSPMNRLSAKEGALIMRSIVSDVPDFLDCMGSVNASSLSRFIPKGMHVKIKSGSMNDVITYIGVKDSVWAFCMMYNGSKESSEDVRILMSKWLSSL